MTEVVTPVTEEQLLQMNFSRDTLCLSTPYLNELMRIQTPDDASRRKSWESWIPTNKELCEVAGIHELEAETDMDASTAFKKEGTFSNDKDSILANTDYLRVVIDNTGRKKLLKEVLGSEEKTKLDTLRTIKNSYKEVLGSKAANLLNYPVKETELVSFGGRVWLSYDFVDNHTEIYGNGEEYLPQLSNPEAIWTRGYFNILLNLKEDDCCQGIISPEDNKYYACDIGVFISKSQSIEDIMDILRTNPVWGFGKFFEPAWANDPRYAPALENFFNHCESITPQAAYTIFENMIESTSERQRLANEFVTRAHMLRQVYNQLKSTT
jgi:hypothetical protein